MELSSILNETNKQKKNRKAPNKQQKNKNETKHETPLNIMIVANAAITLLEKRPDFFSGSAMAAFASIIMSTFNCYCWFGSNNLQFLQVIQIVHCLSTVLQQDAWHDNLRHMLK